MRGCYRAGSCWHTVFLHSTVYLAHRLLLNCHQPKQNQADSGTRKSKSTQPSLRADGTPCIYNLLSSTTRGRSHPLLLFPLGLPPADPHQHGRHGDRHEEQDGDDGDGHGHEVLEAQAQDLRLELGPGDDVQREVGRGARRLN